MRTLSPNVIANLLKTLHVSDSEISPHEFAKGVVHELDHLAKHRALNPGGEQGRLLAAKMALVHLRQIPDYYSRIEEMEADARAYHFGLH